MPRNVACCAALRTVLVEQAGIQHVLLRQALMNGA
jgi:hypothetical protein